MKFINIFLPVLFIVSCVSGKENIYTGSTPAAPVIRSFLGIPLTDSIDFIRWKLVFTDKDYHLQCNYGIGKPNTNGFINGGKKIELSGELRKEKKYYRLLHQKKILNILQLNNNLLYLLDENNTLLVGGGGWSYVLNNESPSVTDEVSTVVKGTVLKDSMSFHGRTPCRGLNTDKNCYKLKWSVVLYADVKTNQPDGCRINGSIYKHMPKNGSWKIITGKDGRIVYQLNVEDRTTLYLLKLDDNILIFTDAQGNLLVGDLDFSYALNRKG